MAKAKQRAFFNMYDCKKFSQLPAWCSTAIYNLGIIAILFANAGKSLIFIILNLYKEVYFFRLQRLALFLNFEQN